MDILGRVDDLSDIKKAMLNACLEDYGDSDGDDTSDVEEFLDQVHQSKGEFLHQSKEEEEGFETALRQMFSEYPVQSPVPLVSALKGSRAKQGLAPTKKLTVTWAPDVYDPPPTSVLHTVRGTKQKKQKKIVDKKKNGKKQKGNNSRGNGGGKDNKQLRRGGGNSVGSPDPYCGSSFLKKSQTRMHYSVAEAL